MSKSSKFSLAGIEAQARAALGKPEWLPQSGASAGGPLFSVSPDPDGLRVAVFVPDGARVEWIESIGSGRVEIDVALGKGASLRWLAGRDPSCSASSRRVRVQLSEGARLEMVESFLLGAEQSHGSDVEIDFAGPRAEATLLARWAQERGSSLCQAAHGRIGREAAGAAFRQSSKALRLGDPKLTLLEPNLSVWVDEATASHGAAHGAVDAEALHGLMSRGLDRALATNLLASAFLRQSWIDAAATAAELSVLGVEEDSWT